MFVDSIGRVPPTYSVPPPPASGDPYQAIRDLLDKLSKLRADMEEAYNKDGTEHKQTFFADFKKEGTGFRAQFMKLKNELDTAINNQVAAGKIPPDLAAKLHEGADSLKGMMDKIWDGQASHIDSKAKFDELMAPAQKFDSMLVQLYLLLPH